VSFDVHKFDEFLLRNNVVGFFENEITLVSGRKSHWYANCRVLQDNVNNINRLSKFILNFVDERNLRFDYFFGVPEGVTKLATVLNYKRGVINVDMEHRLVIGRAKPKLHGMPKDKYFVGDVRQDDRVVMIEDVTTTGGSLLRSIDKLNEVGLNIVAVIGIVNRMEKRDDGKSVEQAIAAKGIPYFYLSNSLRLLPVVARDKKIDKDILNKVEQGFEQYGVEVLKF